VCVCVWERPNRVLSVSLAAATAEIISTLYSDVIFSGQQSSQRKIYSNNTKLINSARVRVHCAR